jgi:DNA polymerase III alpha subunit
VKTDRFGQIILNEHDLMGLYLSDPDRVIHALVEKKINFSDELELDNLPKVTQYIPSKLSVAEFDAQQQSNWHMPSDYYNLDIAEWIVSQCKTDAELNRVAEELLLYQERGMFVLLQYMKFMVDTMRKHHILWGVGRGSSIASYVLFLIGVHRINSLEFELSIDEFLK